MSPSGWVVVVQDPCACERSGTGTAPASSARARGRFRSRSCQGQRRSSRPRPGGARPVELAGRWVLRRRWRTHGETELMPGGVARLDGGRGEDAVSEVVGSRKQLPWRRRRRGPRCRRRSPGGARARRSSQRWNRTPSPRPSSPPPVAVAVGLPTRPPSRRDRGRTRLCESRPLACCSIARTRRPPVQLRAGA